ncbi:MAG: hypothetical protein KDI79_21940 [Anaerolineae bacterium]|nr:hypothetical protein [Anaerolineae bacterium]
MKISLRILTGQGITLRGQIDLMDLPEDLAHQVQTTFTPENLSAAAAAQPNPQMVDASEYELVIYPDDPNLTPQQYSFVDADDNFEVLEILDDIMHEIVRRKKGRS